MENENPTSPEDPLIVNFSESTENNLQKNPKFLSDQKPIAPDETPSAPPPPNPQVSNPVKTPPPAAPVPAPVAQNPAPQFSQSYIPPSNNSPVSIKTAPTSSPDTPSAPTPPQNSGKKILAYVKWPLIIVLPLFFVLGAGAWGLNSYDKYIKKIPIEEILPGDSSLVMKMTSNPDSEQFKLLEANLQKFPGYEILKKNLDEVGEGKTLSQVLQDKLKESNLDFQADIKPLLGDKIYVAVPDLNPLGQGLLHEIPLLTSATQNFAGKFGKNGKTVAENEGNATAPKVLGDSTDWNYIPSSSSALVKLDFITAAEIKNSKEAKKVLDKIKKDSKFETTPHSLNGYEYFEVKSKNESSDKSSDDEESFGSIFKPNKTFHTLLGGNWVMSSNEDLMKTMIAGRSSSHILNKISFQKKDKFSPLSRDPDFRKTIDNVEKTAEDNLLSTYYKINTKEFLKNKDCGESDSCADDSEEYFKQPEIYINGFSIRLTRDGINFKGLSNSPNQDTFANLPYSEGLAKIVPQKINDHWLDLFFEYDNPKRMYYSFKRNNLTKPGLDWWNESVLDVSKKMGVDFEKDIIDQIEGNLAFAMFTGKDTEPQEALIVEIKDPAVIVSAIRKLIDFFKQQYTSMDYGSVDISADARCKNPKEQFEKDICQSRIESQNRIKNIMDSQLVETETPNGKIYSYRMAPGEFSFDFGFVGKSLVLGSHFEATSSLMVELKANQEDKLANNKFYELMSTNLGNQPSYAKTFVNSTGLWNAVNFYLNKYGVTSQEDQDSLFSIGSIVRTIKLIGTANSYSKGVKSSSLFLNIEQLPAEEKKRAEDLLNKDMFGLTSAKNKARVASFKSTVSSTQAAALMCDDGSGKILSGRSNSPICSIPSQGDLFWPEVAENVCEEGKSLNFIVESSNSNGEFRYNAACKINGIKYILSCSQDSCKQTSPTTP